MPTDPFIGRKVAFIFGPIALAIATVFSAKSKAWFGIDINPAEAAVFILSIGAAITTWLYNLGKHEVAQLSGLDEETVDRIVQKVIEEKLPSPPAAATSPGAGSPAAPGAPPMAEQPQPGGASITAGPGGTSPGQ